MVGRQSRKSRRVTEGNRINDGIMCVASQAAGIASAFDHDSADWAQEEIFRRGAPVLFLKAPKISRIIKDFSS